MNQPDTETRRDRKKHEMQQRIVQSAMQLFRTQGLDNTTMEGIANAADVSKRTLYSYFPVKEAIVSGFWLQNAHKKKNQLPLLFEGYPDTRTRLRMVFLSAAEGFMAEPEFARIHFSYQFQQIGKAVAHHFDSDFDHALTAIMEGGQTGGDVRNDIAASELAAQIMLNFTAICLMWFSAPDSFSLEARLTAAVHCFLDGAGHHNNIEEGNVCQK